MKKILRCKCFFKTAAFLILSCVVSASFTGCPNSTGNNNTPTAEQIKITVQGDENVLSGKGISFNVNKGTKWETVQKKSEITGIICKDKFKILLWKLDNISGSPLTDDYIFNTDTTVFAQTKEKGANTSANISISLSSDKMDIEVLVITKNDTPVVVVGCTQSSLENNVSTILNAKKQEIILKGEIIKLVCDSNEIKSLNIQDGDELKEISCKHNNLTSLDLHGLENLETLYCEKNDITNLNVQNCKSLGVLDFKFNKVKVLNISGCQALREIYCENNKLTTLDLQGCTDLASAECQENELVSLNAKGLENLESLDCKENALTSLNIEGCTALSYLNCAVNKLSDLNVKSCQNLVKLYCYKNELTSLDVQNLQRLFEINCEENRLASFNADGCISLGLLAVRKNELKSLNVQNLESLIFLSCHTNQLTSLDVNGLRDLERLICHNNKLTVINIEGADSLIELSCFGNKLNSSAFEKIFTDLPVRIDDKKGKCVLYTEKNGTVEDNHKNFNAPQTLKNAFDDSKITKKWIMFKITADDKKEEI